MRDNLSVFSLRREFVTEKDGVLANVIEEKIHSGLCGRECILRAVEHNIGPGQFGELGCEAGVVQHRFQCFTQVTNHASNSLSSSGLTILFSKSAQILGSFRQS